MEVEDLKQPESDVTRSPHREAKTNYENAIATHKVAKETLEESKDLPATLPDAKKREKEADKARKKAKKQHKKAKDDCDDMIDKHNAKKVSLAQQFECVYRSNGVTREHCHGGKFNGVDWIRTMEKSEQLFMGKNDKEGFLQKCLVAKKSTMDETTLRSKCSGCARLLQQLDCIWSNARGVNAGLVPTTPEWVQELARAPKAGKEQWLALGLSTLQPKWHLTFDGHLLEQAERLQGLADKADDTVEKFHQVLKTLRARFRSIVSHERQERCIRRELRRKRSPKMSKVITRCESLCKQKAGTKRKADTQERQAAVRQAKKERREAAIS